MVEYALLTVGAGLHAIATTTSAWVANIPWVRVGYAVLGLVAARMLWRTLTGARAARTR